MYMVERNGVNPYLKPEKLVVKTNKPSQSHVPIEKKSNLKLTMELVKTELE